MKKITLDEAIKAFDFNKMFDLYLQFLTDKKIKMRGYDQIEALAKKYPNLENLTVKKEEIERRQKELELELSSKSQEDNEVFLVNPEEMTKELQELLLRASVGPLVAFTLSELIEIEHFKTLFGDTEHENKTS